MPELPEVETVVRELVDLAEKKVQKVHAHWERSIEGHLPHFKASVIGKVIERVFRRGKYICILLKSGEVVTVHLRMTGKLVFEPTAKDKNYIRVEFTLNDGVKLYFVDVRKFGRIKCWPSESQLLPDLGPEPLDKEVVYRRLKETKTKREVKKVLLDQAVLTGVGNIYADESLFLSKIHPESVFEFIPMAKIKKLSEVIPEVLLKSIQNMGTTLSDYRTTKNMGGENQNYLKVYGQTGMACKDCKAIIQKVVIGARSSHFCPKCQKKYV